MERSAAVATHCVRAVLCKRRRTLRKGSGDCFFAGFRACLERRRGRARIAVCAAVVWSVCALDRHRSRPRKAEVDRAKVRVAATVRAGTRSRENSATPRRMLFSVPLVKYISERCFRISTLPCWSRSPRCSPSRVRNLAEPLVACTRWSCTSRSRSGSWRSAPSGGVASAAARGCRRSRCRSFGSPPFPPLPRPRRAG